ncbi:SusC/RagA family TonB-linked outer membrane protein [uncultured Mucilaginibacter sp.]|uniref:SusC/RagA family TonB-linked outer membrane protein n=1 Tax=uncultured Mucilaginibacter sp. TaxID=797541 RepID=UPI0026303DA5|nr:SusC/RagA family TonB-linked outer membrane protein [uncultured Mucilaginibacter sp.]
MKKLLHVCTVFLLLFASQAFAQNRTITGTVTSREDNQTLPGVSVIVKGTTKGTQTGSDGRYTLTGVAPGATLVFSFIGSNSVEIKVGASTTVNAVLSSSSRQLTEVAVTSFGVKRQAASLGYSTTNISSKELTVAKPISVANGLTGKVSGLQVSTTNNGLFAPTRITLRGTRSLTGNNTPLIVVDGSIFYSDISTLNPEDIESTTILKGASASAVYGSDASNGVIVITTKHGTNSKTPTITFSQTTQIEKVAYLPALQTQFGSNGAERTVYDFNDLSYYIPYENQSYGPLYNGNSVPLGRTAADGSILRVPYSNIKNQKRDFFNTGLTLQNNFSFASGDESGNFFMSFQDLLTKAVMPGDQGRRDAFRLNGDKKYGIFSANYSAVYTRKYTNTTATGSVYNDLLESPTFIPVSILKDPNSFWGNPDNYYNDYYSSPGQIIKQTRNYNTEDHINANLALNLKPTKWFGLTYRTSIDNTNSRYEFEDGGVTFSPYTHTNGFVNYTNYDGSQIIKGTDAGTKYSASADLLPQYGTNNFSNLLFSSDLLANFNTKINKDFSFRGTLGVAYLDNKITYTPINPSFINFLPYNTSNFVSVSGGTVAGQATSEARKIGYFGEAEFSFRNYAFVHGSYRTDLDSRLSKANRYIPYYDIDGSLVLSEMFKSLVENNNYLSFAKLRYAHSLTGNVSALANGSQYIAYGSYQTTPVIGLANGFPYSSSGIAGYSLSTTVANPNIKPETTIENEIGLDLGFLKDRITFGGSIYKQDTKDGIVYASVSYASGFNRALLNAANTTNEGIELDLSGTAIKSNNVTWTLKGNWTRNQNRTNSIVSGVQQLNIGYNTYAVVGQSMSNLLGYDWNRDPATGKVIVNPNTGYPTKSSVLTNFGRVTPRDIVGITSTVAYKNLSLTITADYRSGYVIYNQIGRTIDHSGVGLTTAVSGRQRFVFPNSVYKDANGNYVNNTNVEVQDANFQFWPLTYNSVDGNYIVSAAAWKLREANLNYAVPTQWLRSRVKYIKGANISISGRNLLMFRPSTNKWTDPEYSETTGNAVGYTSLNQAPPTRLYSGTISIIF